MSSAPPVIVVAAPADADARAGRQIQLGFEREGIPTTLVTVGNGKVELPRDAGLIVVSGTDGAALDLLRATRQQRATAQLDIPILFAGKGVRRTDAEGAGADEIVLFPTHLRDVVTVGRLLRGQPAAKREHIVGSLAETTNVFTLVRALTALGRSAVLTLMRGLRRGEIRFFHGEVTSAELALIHGQAALHQLLLWTEARFEFLHEDVVRRQQIPMTHDELFADAERFLEGVRDSSGSLSPAMVLEQDVQRLQALGRQVPTEVHGVLRMFDGHRVLVDILEDSPYRVFETLRVTQRAVDAGLLRVVASTRPKATWRAVLGIEEWLTNKAHDPAVERATAEIVSGALGMEDTAPAPKHKKRSKRPTAQPTEPSAARSSRADIDWGALVPRIVGAEVGSLSTVVPAAQRSGEISLPSMREEKREKLEAMMNTAQRKKIFPRDLDEPSIVFDEAGERAAADKLEAERVAGKATEKKALADDKAAAEQAVADAKRVAADADAKRIREAEADAADVRLRAEGKDIAKKAAAARQGAVDTSAREAEQLAAKLAATKARTEAPTEEPPADLQPPESGASVEVRPDHRRTPDPDGSLDEEALWRQAEDRARAMSAGQETKPVPRFEADVLVRELLGEKVTVAETPTSTVVVQDTLTIAGSAGTAVVTATATAVVSEAPLPVDDEPSDGIVRQVPTTAKTAPLQKRAPALPPILPDDRPDPAMGEIAARSRVSEKLIEQPSILIEDLAAAHHAVAAVASAQVAAPPTVDAAESPHAKVAATVRADAVALTDVEQAFFLGGSEQESSHRVTNTGPVEKFDDLDDDYQPVGFWDRLRGKKPTK